MRAHGVHIDLDALLRVRSVIFWHLRHLGRFCFTMRLFSILYTATLLLASALADEKGKVEVKTAAKRKTVYAHGRNSNDISNLLAAFKQCDHRGTIVLRGNQNYFLDRKLSLVVNDVTIEWRGTWTFRPDIDHWRQPANQYPIAFQNHVASFVLTGDGIRIDGYGTSMIEGSGDVWYTATTAATSRLGLAYPPTPLGPRAALPRRGMGKDQEHSLLQLPRGMRAGRRRRRASVCWPSANLRL